MLKCIFKIIFIYIPILLIKTSREMLTIFLSFHIINGRRSNKIPDEFVHNNNKSKNLKLKLMMNIQPNLIVKY